MYQKIILASGSPRRRELLTRIGIDFQYVTYTIKEELTDGDDVARQAERLATMKAYDVASVYDEAFIIAADTVVAADGKLYGKPAGPEEIRTTLHALSDRRHEVTTGVAILNKRHEMLHRFSVTTSVWFKPVADSFIDWYIESEEPFGKAGSYAIQGKGCLMVSRIEGDYDNVVGLPVSRLFDVLIEMNVRVPGGPHGISV